ncbi:MAG TPA: response regulator transcription factor [Bacteroidia bacterium]|nr:response regulator transcription factor [Bacteroidia bacterium]
MEQKKILLVEDEEHLLKTMLLNLELEGYEVKTAIDGIDALKKFRSTSFDLIILDVMLPELNGFDVCEEIRKENTRLPILFLTAKGTSSDKVKGLKLGADDYLTKPFNLEELLLRIQILLKRYVPAENTSKKIERYRFSDNEINFITYEIKGINGLQTEITKREIALLKLLIERKGEVISREKILDEVWGAEAFPSSRTIDNYIVAFRKYFEKNQKSPQHFHSIRGVGYKFTD